MKWPLYKRECSSTVSSHSKAQLLDPEGYIYSTNGKPYKPITAEYESQYWKCAKRKCKVSSKTTIVNGVHFQMTRSTDHNHDPNPQSPVNRKLRTEVRKRAKESDDKPSLVIAHSTSTSPSTDYSLSKTALRSIVKRARKGIDETFHLLESYDPGEVAAVTKNGRELLVQKIGTQIGGV